MFLKKGGKKKFLPELFDLDRCDFDDLSDFTDSVSILPIQLQRKATAFGTIEKL